MTETNTGSLQTDDHYRKLKAALIDRITRRWQALVRLSPHTLDADLIESRLASVGDDAEALVRLFDDVERRLDQAFASKSRRLSQTKTEADSQRGPDPVEFKSE